MEHGGRGVAGCASTPRAIGIEVLDLSERMTRAKAAA
jgi:hypothetical protein